MNQKHNKYIKFKKYNLINKLLIIMLITILIFALYMILILISFSPFDPSWLQTTWNHPIYNWGGIFGAWLADTTFFVFGKIAYIIPLFLIFICCNIYCKQNKNKYIDYFNISLKIISIIILACSSCIFANLYCNNFYSFSSGGIIGSLLTDIIVSYSNNLYTITIALLFVYGLGLTLFIEIPWLFIAENIGKVLTNSLIYIYYNKYNHDLLQKKNISDPKIEKSSLNNYFNILSKSCNTKYNSDIINNSLNKCVVQTKPTTKLNTKLELQNTLSKNLPIKQLLSNIFISPSKKCYTSKQNTIITSFPTLDLLKTPIHKSEPTNMTMLQKMANLLEKHLAEYHIKAKVVGIYPGPVIIRFELNLAPGIKSSRITNLSKDIARSLSITIVRVIEVIPGKPYIGIELPNIQRQIIYLYEILNCNKFLNISSPLTLALGKDTDGQPMIADLTNMPHLLIAGTTGSGKSISINAMILSILYKATPREVQFIMIDPKMLELSVYEGIPHLMTGVVTNMKDVEHTLYNCIKIMEQRYKLMSSLGVRNIINYNIQVEKSKTTGQSLLNPSYKEFNNINTDNLILEKLPYIVIIVDELADLIMVTGKKIEQLIIRLAQKSRAAGIHLILATQRPSVDVITGLIKASIPTRIAFTVLSKIDSRTILDQNGAESLLGMGDMLYLTSNASLPIRIHGAYVHDDEVHAVVDYWISNSNVDCISSKLKNK